MLVDDYVRRLRDARAARRERLARLRTRSAALAYQRHARNAIRRAFGPQPPRTPLNARVVGSLRQRHHTLEKVVFESRPGCLVTAHLYVPHDLRGPAPAVLGTCGHSATGKMEPLYQEFCQRLARAGFVVLIYDPFNQGERDQYWLLPDRQAVASCTHAHNMMGKQLELVGQWFGAWRAWDGIRALDYLLSRPEVDPTRVGITGNSGGGTMTTWLWAYEDRFTMAAPSCFVTTFLANLENELPADCEQYPPGVIGAGLEMADFLLARAPKPVLLLGQRYDYFDRRGLEEAYGDVRAFYALLGAPEDAAQLFVGPRPHGFSVENQEAMVAFFARHAGLARVVRLRRPEHLDEASGRVTPAGNTVAAGATPIYAQVAAIAAELASARPRPAREDLPALAARTLNLPLRAGTPHYHVLRPYRLEAHTMARYAVETERDIRALVHKRLLDPGTAGVLETEPHACVWLSHAGATADLETDPLARRLLASDALYAVDVRGLGESAQDDGDGGLFHPYGMDYMMHGYGLLLGESYLGRRVHDVLRVLDLLGAKGVRRVTLYGRGQGAVIGLFAGLLHELVDRVVLKNGPLSYAEWTEAPLVAWPAANMLRGALTVFDLPDLMGALGDRLRLVEPWGPDMQPASAARVRQALRRAGLSPAVLARGPA